MIANPFLFACGVPRSGTTLLQRMLDHHPELTVTNDSHFIPRALELTNKSLIPRAEAGLPIALTPELAKNVREYHRFWRMEIENNDFETVKAQSETYQQLVTGLYGLSARKSNKRLAGEKTPDYVRRLPLLQGLFPSAKLIHIVRDGRDVALSLMQWAKPEKGPGRLALWNVHPVAVSALWWRWLAMQSRDKRLSPNSYFEVRYERLVQQPESTMERLCDFLGLDYSSQMLEYHRGKSRGSSTNGSAKGAWLAPQTGLRNWKTDMDPEQIELFELLAADALQIFGYELQNRTSSRKSIETARQCRHWWNENFLTKHRRQKTDSEKTDSGQSMIKKFQPT